jgi:hypothetical protein
MAAFAYGFRDALEAALIIGLALAALIRLGRPAGVKALWIGAGAGALLGFSIGTGLASAGLSAAGSGWTAFELATMALSIAALVGLLFASRRFADESGPCLWLAVACGLFAALPQTIDTVSYIATNQGDIATLAVMAIGMAFGAGLAALASFGLLRLRLGHAPAANVPVAGELAPVRQRVD